MNYKAKKAVSIMLIVACMGGVSGCGTQRSAQAEENNEKPIAVVEKVKEEVVKEDVTNEEVKKIKIESDDIDFSGLKYVLAEKERNEKLELKIKDEISYNKEIDGPIRYFYNDVDLNGDGNLETFVMLIGRAVSGSGGSTAFIFEKDGEEYKKIGRFTLVNNPVIISDEKTNGWNNIIMSVYGGGADPFFAKLQYDGESYPSNPSVQPAVEAGTKVTGTAIISDEIVFGYGLELE